MARYAVPQAVYEIGQASNREHLYQTEAHAMMSMLHEHAVVFCTCHACDTPPVVIVCSEQALQVSLAEVVR